MGTFPVVHLLDLHLRRIGARERHFVAHLAVAAHKRGRECVEKDGKAETARVDDVVLLQDRQQIRRALDRRVRFRDHGVQHGVRGSALFLRSFLHGLGSVAQNGENSAFHRLANRLERHVDRMGERSRKGCGVQAFRAFEAFAETAKDLGRDNARVTARAHKGTVGDGLAHVSRARADRQARNVLHDHLERERHVRARVAVRDGEHVEAVDLFLARGQRLRCRRDSVHDLVFTVVFGHVCLCLLVVRAETRADSCFG